MSDQRRKCQRDIWGRPFKRGPYPNANGWHRPVFVFANEKARLASLMRHSWWRRQFVKQIEAMAHD